MSEEKSKREKSFCAQCTASMYRNDLTFVRSFLTKIVLTCSEVVSPVSKLNILWKYKETSRGGSVRKERFLVGNVKVPFALLPLVVLFT